MAITATFNGGGFSITSNTTVATGATPDANATNKDWLVVVIATSNDGTSGAAPTITVADAGGVNVYTQQAKINYTPTATAGDGATLAIFTSQITSTISNSIVTATFSPACAQKCIQTFVITPTAGETLSVAAVDTTGSTGNTTTHSAATVSVTSGDVILGAVAIETDDTVTVDSDTTNGSWTSAHSGQLADAGVDAAAMWVMGQTKIVTATGNQSFAQTTASARDSARTYIIFHSAATAKVLDATTPGSYALTGTDATTRRNLPMVADAGDYVLTGTDATVFRNLPMVADPGSYALTGTDATLTLASPFKTIVADAGSYTLTGTDATLAQLFNKSLAVDSGVYSQSGTDANTLHKWVLDATTAGSYALTGIDAPTTHQWKLDATTAAAYALTGTDVTLSHGFFIAAELGTYALIGTDASLRRNLPMVADAGSYLLTGTDATTTHQWKLDATTPGSYTLVGTDAALTITSNKAIAAESGTYSLTGTDVTLTLFSNNKTIVADPGSYALLGTDAATTHQWKLDATTAGSYSLAGQDANLLHKWILDATTAGSYALLGTDAATTHQWKLDATVAGSYALTGTDATTLHRWVLDATTAGSYALTGTDATLTHPFKLDATVAESYVLTGTDVTLTTTGAFAIAAESGAYALTGTDATLTLLVAKSVIAEAGDYLLTGTNVTLTYQPTVPEITVPTRGEWPEKERKRRLRKRPEVTAREDLRVALDRLYDGGEYDAPVEALEEAATKARAVVNVLTKLPDIPLIEVRAAEDLIRSIQEMLRQRVLEEERALNDVAMQIAHQHLIDTIIIADEVYRRTRQNYLIKTLLLIAE